MPNIKEFWQQYKRLLEIFCVAGSFIVVSLIWASPANAAWYNLSWSYRVKVTVQNTEVDADLTNFPVFVNLANLPAGFHTNVNQTDARDIRVTKADGTTELAREVMFYTAASDTGEIHFLADALSNASDTDFYIYYGNASASDYAVTDTYGRNAVWADYIAVYHLNEASGGSGAVIDATGNGHNGTDSAGLTFGVSGKLSGNGITFPGGSDSYIDVGTFLSNGKVTITSWFASSYTASHQGFFDFIGNSNYGTLSTNFSSSRPLIYLAASNYKYFNSAAQAYLDGNWHYLSFYLPGSAQGDVVNATLDIDATSIAGGAATQGEAQTTWSNFRIAQGHGNNDFTGTLDEFRITNLQRSADWVAAEYSNQNTSTTFYAVGAEELVFTRVQGVVYMANESTVATTANGGPCDGSTAVISIRVNTGSAATGSCNATTAAFDITAASAAASGDTISVYLTSTLKANTVYVSDGNADTGIDLYENTLVVGHKNAGPVTILDLLDYDSTTNNTDMLFDAVDSTPDTLTVEDTVELHVRTAETFTPGGTVTTSPSADGTDAVKDGDIHIDGTGTLSMGTNALSVGGDFTNEGTFSKSTGQTTTFTATATGHTITDGGENFDTVVFNGTSGGWSLADSTTIDVDLTMTAGTLSGTQDLTVNGGDVTGDGDINLTGGTFLLDGATATGFGGATAWDFNNLTFGDGSGTTTTTAIGAGSVTVAGAVIIAANQTLDAGSKTWILNAASVSGWWSTSWQNRRKITLNNSASSENLMNFPVLVQLSSSNIDFNKVKAGGADLRFIDTDGTVLPYEIEGWDEAGNSYLWVKVPQIDSASATDYIWMYYNNPGADDCETDASCPNAVNVWSSSYLMVHHLGESSGTINDSTSQNNDSATVNSMTYQSAGKVGKSILFDEVDDYYTVGDFNYGDSFTVSMWLKVTDNVGTIHKYLFSHDTVDTNPSLNILVIEDSASAPTGGPDDMAVIMRANTSGDEAMLVDTPTDTNVTDGSWHYVTVTRTQSGTNYTYVNGVSQVSSSATANAFDPAGAINIARREDGTSDRYFDGNLDEIRIANTPRSAEWVEADYLFTNDSSKYTYASEEASAPFVILGTFTPTTSTISYRSTSATNIVPTTYYNLDSKPASGSPTHAIGTGTLNVANNFTVGDGTNAVTVNATTSDPGITVTGTFTVAASATFVASDSASFTLKGNFTNNGTFTNSSGTVTYQPTSESPVVIGGSTATTFHNFTSTIPSGLQNITLQFKASQAAGFAGTLTLTGQMGKPLYVQSDSFGSQWQLNLTGSGNVTYVILRDSGCYGGTNSIAASETNQDFGNNGTCWGVVSRGGGEISSSGGGTPQSGGGQSGGGTTTIVFDAASSSANTAVGSLTWSHTVVASGTERVLIVGVSHGSGGSVSVSGVTYAGQGLTSAGNVAHASGQRVYLWYRVAPTVGANDVVVTLAGGTADVVGGAVSFTGVQQATPLGTFSSTTGTSTTPSLSAASTSGDVVVDVLAAGASPTVDGSQAQRWNTSGGAIFGAGSTETAAGATTTMSWSGASSDWALAAVPVRPASASGGGSGQTGGGQGGGSGATP